jgi:hypothetical protein
VPAALAPHYEKNNQLFQAPGYLWVKDFGYGTILGTVEAAVTERPFSILSTTQALIQIVVRGEYKSHLVR